MTIQFSRQGMAAIPMTAPVAKSSFVRRLLKARDDAATRRVRAWILEIDDDRQSVARDQLESPGRKQPNYASNRAACCTECDLAKSTKISV